MDPTVRQASEVNSVADYNSYGMSEVGAGVGMDGPYTREGVGAVYRKVKSDYYEEALRHPGVRLVAHAVV
jgi:L-aminopeptidase/D-esterase-like protein